jgi:hypothetical protein
MNNKGLRLSRPKSFAIAYGTNKADRSAYENPNITLGRFCATEEFIRGWACYPEGNCLARTPVH